MFQNWVFQIRFSKISIVEKFVFLIEFSVARVPRPEFCAAGISPQNKQIRPAMLIEFDVRRYGGTIMRRYAALCSNSNCELLGKGVRGGCLPEGRGGPCDLNVGPSGETTKFTIEHEPQVNGMEPCMPAYSV